MLNNEQPTMTPFEAGVKIYEMTRNEGDRDLVTEVREMFINEGEKEETLQATYDINRHIVAAKPRVPLVQRTQINRFVTLALLSCPENTIGMRAQLLPNGSIDAWVDQMQSKVVPFIVSRKLLG